MINRLSILAVVSLAFALPSFAAIPFTVGLTYNSGVNPFTGAPLTGGSSDLLFNVDSFTPTPLAAAATVVPAADNGPGWVTSPTAQWIAPSEDQSGDAGSGAPAGSYTYQGSFASDFLVTTTVTVTGAFAADNSAQLYIAGVLAASTSADGSSSLTPIDFTFTVQGGLSILPVQFVVDNPSDTNAASPSGLLVSDLVFSTSTATPEPSTWMLLGGGICALVFVQRRRAASLL